MKTATLSLDPTAVVAPVRRRTFGSFIEHLGRAVYTGIHEPDHPTADGQGFRTDVIDLVRELGVSTVRYPGGNFVSGYRWEDGIGPVADRPARLDLAWHSTEPNTVGVDEFMAWAGRAGIEPMMAVNLGTRGIQEALDLLEYCNADTGTHLANLRAHHGSAQPYNVRMWCLGNEMDGKWQIGHRTATEYGRLAGATARAMRMFDPTLELVACGSSGTDMPTFGSWEAEVLTELYDDVDMISAHAYYWEKDHDLASFLASAVGMDHFIDSVVATADHVRAAKKSTKTINISFDEWNVWYINGKRSTPPTDWPVAPRLLEDQYNFADAVVVGSLLISLLKHTERVVSASLAQLVNVIAPIMTEPGGKSWKQTIFHPFAQASHHATGDVLPGVINGAFHDTAVYGTVPTIDAVATHDQGTSKLTILAVNRDLQDDVEFTIDVRSFNTRPEIQATQLTDPNPHRTVTADTASMVAPITNSRTSIDHAGNARVLLSPISWNVIQMDTSPAH